MATATSRPPAPMANSPRPPQVGVWESDPKRVMPGHGEPFQVDLVADAVAGAGKVYAVLGGHGLQVTVVVGVLKAGLEHVMVHVGHGKLGLDLGNAHGLELEVGHGAGGVLGEGLVDPDAHFLPGHGFAGNQMGVDDFLD